MTGTAEADSSAGCCSLEAAGHYCQTTGDDVAAGLAVHSCYYTAGVDNFAVAANSDIDWAEAGYIGRHHIGCCSFADPCAAIVSLIGLIKILKL